VNMITPKAQVAKFSKTERELSQNNSVHFIAFPFD
jgi:hypothetical protein